MKLNLTAAVAAGFLAVAVAGSAQAAEPGKFTPAQARSLEDWSYAAALNAATWGSPIVTMYALRYNDAVGPNVKAAPNAGGQVRRCTASVCEPEAPG